MMTGAEALVQSLVREGVDVVFAYPGGASMPIHQALSHEPSIRTILPRHEQGGAFGLQGTGEGRSFTVAEQQTLVSLCAEGIGQLIAKQKEILEGLN